MKGKGGTPHKNFNLTSSLFTPILPSHPPSYLATLSLEHLWVSVMGHGRMASALAVTPFPCVLSCLFFHSTSSISNQFLYSRHMWNLLSINILSLFSLLSRVCAFLIPLLSLYRGVTLQAEERDTCFTIWTANSNYAVCLLGLKRTLEAAESIWNRENKVRVGLATSQRGMAQQGQWWCILLRGQMGWDWSPGSKTYDPWELERIFSISEPLFLTYKIGTKI